MILTRLRRKRVTVVADSAADTETADAGLVADADALNAEDADQLSVSDPLSTKRSRGAVVSRIVAFGVLPAVVVAMASSAGFLKWQDTSTRDSQVAGVEAMQAARDSTVAILSYQPDSVDKQLGAARDLLTGSFKESYTSLIHDVVIPGAKQKQISAVATVPASAVVSAGRAHAVALVFVNQTTIVGNGAPTDSASVVRVTLEKVGEHWLVSQFDPV